MPEKYWANSVGKQCFSRTIAQGSSMIGLAPYLLFVGQSEDWPVGSVDSGIRTDHILFNGPERVLGNLALTAVPDEDCSDYDLEALFQPSPDDHVPGPYLGHGTCAAHILSGNDNAGEEYAGLSQKPIVCIIRNPFSANEIDLDAIQFGLEYLLQIGCRAVVLELQLSNTVTDYEEYDCLDDLGTSKHLEGLVKELYESGVALLAPAGNNGSGTSYWPGSSRYVLTTGAHTRNAVPGFSIDSATDPNDGSVITQPATASEQSGEWEWTTYKSKQLEEFNAYFTSTSSGVSRSGGVVQKPEVYCPTHARTAAILESCTMRPPSLPFGGTSGAVPFLGAAAAVLRDFFRIHLLDGADPGPGQLYAALIASTEMPYQRVDWPYFGGEPQLTSETVAGGKFVPTVSPIDPVLGAGYLHLPHPEYCVWRIGSVVLDSRGRGLVDLQVPTTQGQGVLCDTWRLRVAIWWADPLDHHHVVALKLSAGGNIVQQSSKQNTVFQKVEHMIYSGAEAEPILLLGGGTQQSAPSTEVHYCAIFEPSFD